MRTTTLHRLLAIIVLALAPNAMALQDDAPRGDDAPQTTQAPAPVYRAVEHPELAGSDLATLRDPQETIQIEFTHLGAGIESLILLDEFETVEEIEHVEIQGRRANARGTLNAVPFAALAIEIDGVVVNLAGRDGTPPIWVETAPGVFEARIVDDSGDPVLRLERRFELRDGRHGFVLTQRVENLSDAPRTVQLISSAMVDMPQAENSYAGDRRRFRIGFMRDQTQQGGSLVVSVDPELDARTKILGSKVTDVNGTKHYAQAAPFWPSEKALKRADRLSWLAFNDRYYSVVLHPVFEPASTDQGSRLLAPVVESMDRFVLDQYAGAADTTILMTTRSAEFTVEPGATESLALGVYAGPRTKPIFADDPVLAALSLPDMVVYNIGGFCAGCTFDWLTHILIEVLRVFHSLTGDWAIAIMLLVVLVRACLHPVTRWSQIRMQRFSVQMQSMGPKQKALREKYKDDPKKLQQEMTKLWREEGVSPMGMLGCLPMMLQSPVWIALYATLFFAVELKHEPAFYGVFQTISGGSWQFLADLSAADHAIPLPQFMHFSFPLWGSVQSINLLPILLGFVFFAHQKFLTPPSTATLTPEQESQQKMMKVMMVVMFPVMMYTAPSGLSLYFITNSTLGIFESKWIRAHMQKHGMLEIENIRAEKAKKGPGLMQRMSEAAEARKQIEKRGPAPINPASREFRRRQK